MKKKLFIAAVIGVTALAGCDTEVNRVSYNLSQEADNFNDIRQITVINCLQGDVLFQMTGKMSITADTSDNQLEIIVEDENGEYKKHFIGLSDNVTYPPCRATVFICFSQTKNSSLSLRNGGAKKM